MDPLRINLEVRVFEDDCKRPLHIQLMARGKFLRPALWGKIHSEPLQDSSQPLCEITMAEASEKEWLRGPLTYDEIDFLYEGDWLPVRSFAVFHEKAKWRPIDDFSENGVNGSFGPKEKVDLRALDETVWLSVGIMRADKSGRYSFRLADGSHLCTKRGMQMDQFRVQWWRLLIWNQLASSWA